ncbi:MAG: hypothetical protein K2Q20_05025 [Phycisphaerales bacterium]|nr:hypothetical protein [Phycisphaerales bacterium]
MRIALLTVGVTLPLVVSAAAIGQQQQQQQPAPAQGVQPAPWRKFPTGLGGVPANTAPANPGSMLDRRTSRNLIPTPPQPAPTTPAMGGSTGGKNMMPGGMWPAAQPGLVVTTPSFRIGDRTFNFGDFTSWQRYSNRTGLDFFSNGSFSPLGGAILRRYGGDTLDFGATVSPRAIMDCSPAPRYLIPPTYRGNYFRWSDTWRRWYDDRYDYAPIGNGPSDGFAPRVPEPDQAQPTPPTLTTMQQAAEALQRGDATAAASLYQQRLGENDNDALAQRGLALVLLEQRKIDQAIAVLGQTYVKYPWLSGMPIQASSLPGGERDLRSRFNTIMTYANRAGTASSLLAAAVIAQAEDRADVALKLVDRAQAAGLEPKVTAAMRTALGK